MTPAPHRVQRHPDGHDEDWAGRHLPLQQGTPQIEYQTDLGALTAGHRGGAVSGRRTSRVSSDIGVEDVAARVTAARVTEAIRLLHQLQRDCGIAAPRLGVAALNPHNGENGIFGREEIDEIRPGVASGTSTQNALDVAVAVASRQLARTGRG